MPPASIPLDANEPELSCFGRVPQRQRAEKEKRGPTAESKHGGCRTEMNRLAWGLGFTLAVAVGLQARVIMVRVGIDCMCAGDGDQEAV